MAMVKTNPLFPWVTGPISGQIFRLDNCGLHCQAWPRQVKSRTLRQARVRNGFTDLHFIYFHRLDYKLRALWTLYGIQHPMKGKSGNDITIPGWPMFLKYNQPNWLKGIPPVWIPPGYKLPSEYEGLHAEWQLHWFYMWGA